MSLPFHSNSIICANTKISHRLYIFRIILLIFFIVSCTSLKKYAIYDIYNNAYTHGGHLNVTFDRHFLYDVKNGGHLSESRIQLRSKYANRRNLSDITFRLGLIVNTVYIRSTGRLHHIILLFQLPRTKDRYDTKSVLAYLLTDNDTTIDTQQRHAANVVSIVGDMLNCK